MKPAAPRRLAVFARPARPGSVKTRLSPALPPPLACRLHLAMLEDTLASARALTGVQVSLWWSDPPREDDPLPRGAAGIEVYLQDTGDLGRRLATAFDRLLEGNAHAVVIGSDAPALEPGHLAAAFTALERHELVLGPARDGGYWLIGLARGAPALFEGVAWSGPTVLDQTLERARGARLECASLETLDDLDTPADLVRLLARLAVSGPNGPDRTTVVLECMGLLPER